MCKLRLSEIENDLLKIIRKYEGTNLWLSINEQVEKLLSRQNGDGYVKRIKMKDNTTKFIWDGDNCVGKYTELIEQYHYDSEEEKMEHKIEMELNGWNDSGQVMEMISGSLMPGAKNPPVHVWFGSYYKTIKI